MKALLHRQSRVMNLPENWRIKTHLNLHARRIRPVIHVHRHAVRSNSKESDTEFPPCCLEVKQKMMFSHDGESITNPPGVLGRHEVLWGQALRDSVRLCDIMRKHVPGALSSEDFIGNWTGVKREWQSKKRIMMMPCARNLLGFLINDHLCLEANIEHVTLLSTKRKLVASWTSLPVITSAKEIMFLHMSVVRWLAGLFTSTITYKMDFHLTWMQGLSPKTDSIIS